MFASITGAWIETATKTGYKSAVNFASITGAWIETLSDTQVCGKFVRVHHGRVD